MQFFGVGKWHGGYYATLNLAGSRPGNVIAGTWAVMMKHGSDGYLETAKLILEAN